MEHDNNDLVEENEYAERLRELYFELEKGADVDKGTAYEKLCRFLMELPRNGQVTAPAPKRAA